MAHNVVMEDNLITSALAVIMAVPGHTRRSAAAQLVASLNADLGTAYDTARLGQWRRGERSIPQPVQGWLLRVGVCWAIEQCGGVPPAGDEAIDRLAALLGPPRRFDDGA